MPRTASATTTLWRATGEEELGLVRESRWCRWPPRLPGQPIFYPVLNEEYATQIARDWNTKHGGTGYHGPGVFVLCDPLVLMSVYAYP